MSAGDADTVQKLLKCVGGSETGDKIAAAFKTCLGTESNMDASRNTEQCHDFETTVGWISQTYANDICILKEMGWLNENMTGYNWDQWIHDINYLPEEVSGVR